jgi:hypothetical protein
MIENFCVNCGQRVEETGYCEACPEARVASVDLCRDLRVDWSEVVNAIRVNGGSPSELAIEYYNHPEASIDPDNGPHNGHCLVRAENELVDFLVWLGWTKKTTLGTVRAFPGWYDEIAHGDDYEVYAHSDGSVNACDDGSLVCGSFADIAMASSWLKFFNKI